MKKYIILFVFFTMLCIIGFAKELSGTIFMGALMAGYCMSKIQYKYTRKQRFRNGGIYNFR